MLYGLISSAPSFFVVGGTDILSLLRLYTLSMGSVVRPHFLSSYYYRVVEWVLSRGYFPWSSSDSSWCLTVHWIPTLCLKSPSPSPHVSSFVLCVSPLTILWYVCLSHLEELPLLKIMEIYCIPHGMTFSLYQSMLRIITMNQPSSSSLFPFAWTWFLLLEQFVCHFSIFIISCLNRFCFDSLVTTPSSGTFHLLFMMCPYLPLPPETPFFFFIFWCWFISPRRVERVLRSYCALRLLPRLHSHWSRCWVLRVVYGLSCCDLNF